MISVSSFKNFVNKVYAAKYPEMAPGVESDINPDVIQSHHSSNTPTTITRMVVGERWPTCWWAIPVSKAAIPTAW